ncbi:MAG: hypothetical protein OQK76_10120 [Gammaproteobacteria bacterium]|nr:hypothetical protein [Gammaproteobacteria bacterium]MCW8910958.1 hypothetical protein [Gammaproteobacteria bacterium]MCW9005746.1 hypothetical protein [Gammaproteobacteria bacterium]MCW9055631.1 hypothetical protein [Gammaproteobacteria bacterium]
MKTTHRIQRYTLGSLLAVPILIAIISAGIIVSYSDATLLFLLGS